MRAGTSDGGRLQATLDSPGLAPVVGVIAPQLKAPPTALRNRKSGEETRGFNRLEEEQQTKPQELAVRNAEC
jgi:hypothetical protein